MPAAARTCASLLSVLPDELTRDGIVAVGYSLGGAMLLKYLGEEGAASPLEAAATVSAPIDLAVTCRHMMRPRNRIYHRYILDLMKVEATGEGAIVSAAERAAILGARTVWDYDDVFIAPRYGFASAEDYYERCRPTAVHGRHPRSHAGAGRARRSLDSRRALSGATIGRPTRRCSRFCPTPAAMSAFTARAAGSLGATWPWRGSLNMVEGNR